MKFTTYVKELINEWVYGIAVDKQDRVWFGTEGGVSMFDGKHWRSWSHKDGLGAPNQNKLSASPKQASEHDRVMTLACCQGKENSLTTQVMYLPCKSLQINPFGQQPGAGSEPLRRTRWQNFTTREGLAGDIVYSMAQDSNGVLWFGTNNGISRYDGKIWHNYDKKDGLLEDNVYALAVAPSGDIWAGSRRGVTRIGR